MKILYYIRGLNIGGAETFIYNILSEISTEYKIDIVLQTKENKNQKLLKLCKNKGVNLYYITPFEKNIIKSTLQVYRILKDNNYDIIHIHLNSLLNITAIIAGVSARKKIILHSHNTKNNQGGKIGLLLHKINSYWINKLKIIRIACGEEAGKWMYNKNNFYIINNAIDLEKYRFNEQERNNLRSKLQIHRNEIVIGHIGRFVEAKNHYFLLKIFNEILKENSNYRLILIGNGKLEEKIKERAIEMNIIEKIIFLTNIQDTSRYYSIFDLFLFPSLFEGLPFVLVEAQTSGVKIIASDTITKEINITNSIKYLTLIKNEKYWSEYILEEKGNTKEIREKLYLSMKESIYDIKYEIKKIEKIYDNTQKGKI